MVIDIDYVYTAIDKAKEEMAQRQFELAERGRFSGDSVTMDNNYRVIATLAMNVEVLEGLDLGIDTSMDETIEVVLENIKELTKDTRQWD